MGSRAMNFIMLFYSKVQFREKHLQSLLISIEILGSACVFNIKFLGTTKAKRQNEAVFNRPNAYSMTSLIDVDAKARFSTSLCLHS